MLAALALAACVALAPAPAAPAKGMVRYGPDRASIPYAEKHAAAKAALLAKINTERKAAGLRALAYDLLAAKVGDEFCEDAAVRGTNGHWDTRGRAPYQRWGEAGGVDYHSENFSAHSRFGEPFGEPVESLLLSSHASMMAERPPNDGHRRTVLDPIWTHVGIGASRIGGEFRMTEEYSREVAEWVDAPAGVQAAGTTVRVTVKLPRAFTAGPVEVAYEKRPSPLSPAQIARRGGYGYPQTIRRLFPKLGAGAVWEGGGHGDFDVTAGRADVKVALDAGAGNYYILLYAGEGEISGKRLSPATAVLIRAE